MKKNAKRKNKETKEAIRSRLMKKLDINFETASDLETYQWYEKMEALDYVTSRGYPTEAEFLVMAEILEEYACTEYWEEAVTFLSYQALGYSEDALIKFLDLACGRVVPWYASGEKCTLFWAARNGELSLLRRMVEELDAPVNALYIDWGGDDEFGTVLSMAVKSGNLKLCRYLLDKGADPNFRLDEIEVPIAQAIKHNYVKIARLLLERGATLDDLYCDDEPFDAFEFVRQQGNEEMLRLLQKAKKTS